MRRVIIMVALCAMVALCGCIPVSINPFYSSKDVVFDSLLVGAWGEEDGKSRVVFEKADSNSYVMTDQSDQPESKFDVHLFKLGSNLYMDLYPRLKGGSEGQLLSVQLIKAHSLLWVHQVASSLVTSSIDQDKLKKLLAAKPALLPHLTEDDRTVFTASTEELQNFITRYLSTADLFEAPSEMKRMPK
jgi:hypothetical protein